MIELPGLVRLFGEFSWTPPAWLRRFGVRRASWCLLGLLGVVVLAAGVYVYYLSLPAPLRVVVDIRSPGITAIVDDELAPDPVHLDFRYSADPDGPTPPPISAARIDLVGEPIEEGIELRPAAAGQWHFETENRLVFMPAEDWPAGREYTVRLSSELFAPGIELAEEVVEFETPAFVAAVTEASFYQHPEVAGERRVVAGFDFSHAVSRVDFEARLGLSMREGSGETAARGEARPLAARVEYGPHDRTAHVLSEIVAIPERENFVTAALDARLQPADGDGVFDEKLSVQVRVPDRASYFRAESIRASIVDDAEGDPVQTAIVTFTDQVNTNDFAGGIRAWLLPKEHKQGTATFSWYFWRSPREVTPDVLSRSEPVEVLVNPTERDAATLQSVAFDAPPSRFVYLRITAGLVSEGGFVLGSDYDEVVEVPDYPKEAAIAQDGALLPLTGNRLLTLSSRGVTAVKVDIQQLLPGTVNHFASQSNGDIRDPWFSYNFDVDNLSSLTTRIVDVNPGHPRERVYATLDLEPFLDAGGLFFVTVQGWDPGTERVVGSSDRRMALVTDLGLLVKTNVDKSQDVFVHSIATGDPVAAAQVELLGKNGLPVHWAATDARGHVRLESASDFKRGQKPTVFVVRHGGDVTFMPYERRDRRLTWSGFDIGGERATADEAERLRAAVYTDRGLYRPGETVRLFGIVRRGDIGKASGVPLEVVVSDARASRVLVRRTTLPDDGLLVWDFETRVESPTGRYRANVYMVDDKGGRHGLGDVSFSVEDYQPDRLRIRASIMEREGADQDEPSTRESPQRGWLRPGAHYAHVALENLFGTPAQGRRVQGALELQPMAPRFDEHPDFVFTDPYRDPDAPPRSVTLRLAEAVTGDDGTVRLPFDVGQYDNGIYRLVLAVEGFEAGGGRGVEARAATLMTPADALLGYRADGDLDFIALDGERTVRFLAIDRDLAPTAVEGIEAVLYERRYVSALVRQPNGTYAYQSVVKETEVERVPFALPASGAPYVVPSARPGRFALELRAADGVKLSRVEFAVAGAANIAGNLERNAELDLKLDRREYAPGDEIVLEITAPYAGIGLVTIERDRVHAFEWFRSETNTAVASIRVPDDLEGNAYVNVAFVRDIASEEIFVSPLSYAIAPFAIDRAARRLDVDLEAPERILPGEPLTLTYSTPEPARLVLFAVDEGILQVAKYATPDPLERFLAKQALQVDTHQMVDLILPDYEVVRRVAAPGGGGDFGRQLGANLNPFRRRSEPPVVFWGGVREAGPAPRQAVFEVPDYFNGELRVVAVAVADAKLGASAAPVTVRGPIVLTPNLPLAVAPDDVFDVSVGVANNVDGSGAQAEIALAAGDWERLSADGDPLRTLAIAQGGEGRAIFRLRAGAMPGAASFRLTARLGETVVERGASLSVRPAVPYETTVASGFDADTDIGIDLPRRLHASFANRRITASASPLALADGLLAYLDRFPHACTEQLVSKVFPQLGLLRSPSFGLRRAAYSRLFRKTVSRLRERQDADGGFRFWATSDEAVPFHSVYVTHFLAEASALGMAVPADMRNRARGYLQRIANASVGQPSSAEDLAAARTRAYAIYVLTRQGMVTTNYLNALQEALDQGFGEDWRTDIASAYMAASHALLRNDVLAQRLIAGYRFGESSRPDTDFDTRLGRDAQYVFLLARHFPARIERFDGEAVRRLVEPVFDNRFNTLSAAYTILALGELHRALEEQGVLMPPTIAASGPDGPIELEVTDDAFARASLPVAVDRVEISGADGSVYFSVGQSGFDVTVPSGPLAQGIEVDRVYLDAEGEPVDRVRLGDELTVRLRVRSQKGPIRNVAVTDLLPGGFEIVTESVGKRHGSFSSDYRDVREDRLVLYGAFDETVTEIRYRVKATSPGDFVAPAAHAAAMYHRNVRGRSAPGRLVVQGA